MKKIVFVFILCLGFGGLLEAQNIWKSVDLSSFESCNFLGVGTDGCMYVESTYGIIYRSKDEGNTWESIFDNNNGDHYLQKFAINKNNRVFSFDIISKMLFYSDDDGDSWQQTTPIPLNTIWVRGLCCPSNDTLVGWTSSEIFWSINGGATWDYTSFDFIDEETGAISCVIVNNEGDFYASVMNTTSELQGIYHATFADMQDWALVAFEGYQIGHMTFDPEGSVVANSTGEGSAGWLHEPGFYLITTRELAVADNGFIYRLKYEPDDQVRLNYSLDHGEHFYDIGETMPVTYIPYPGSDDASLFKGRDNHLYYRSRGVFYKSIKNADDILGINGTVARVPAPFFENNAVDTRMAIVSEEETYYVTVDGYWTNPEIDALIVRYDTIPEGSVIDAYGNTYEMVDDRGDTFKVLDVQQTSMQYNEVVIGAIWYNTNPVYITNLKPPYETYVITLNGEPQTYPFVFNGVNLSGKRAFFVGHCSEQIDANGEPYMAMELQKAIPFDNAFQCDGYLTTNYIDPLCLTAPCEDLHYLTCVSFDTPIYLTRNGKLYPNSYLNNEVFGENYMVNVKGVVFDRYDIYGREIQTVEVVEMSTDDESSLYGVVEDTPIPCEGFMPVPGLTLALVHNGRKYCIANPQDGIGEDVCFFVGNDTVCMGQEIRAAFTTEMRTNSHYGFYYYININQVMIYEDFFPTGTEWYYEIQDENGNISYQHLQCVGDTTIGNERPKIVVCTNQIYDKGRVSEAVTHEYIYEDGARVYWWNKRWNEFSMIYNFAAEEGDEWRILGSGNEGYITVHVDSVSEVVLEGKTYRMLQVSDENDYFSGNILCGVGHLTSFFPEKHRQNNDFEVDHLRCYWQDDNLVLKFGNEDCDAIHSVINTVDEINTEGFLVYPNPTDGLLYIVETQNFASLPLEYRITNLMGQTLMTGTVSETIDVSTLPIGMYFITIDGATQKFIIKR